MSVDQPNGAPPTPPHAALPQALQPAPTPMGWQTSTAVFRRPGETLVLVDIQHFSRVGTHHLFLAPADLGKYIKDLQAAKLEAERTADREKPGSPSRIIIPGGGQSPTTGG